LLSALCFLLSTPPSPALTKGRLGGVTNIAENSNKICHFLSLSITCSWLRFLLLTTYYLLIALCSKEAHGALFDGTKSAQILKKLQGIIDKLNEVKLKDPKELDVKSSIKPDKEPRSLINQMLVEYGLLIVLIAVFVMLMMGSAGEHVNQLWSRINSGISR
jgi:hypothetical protein